MKKSLLFLLAVALAIPGCRNETRQEGAGPSPQQNSPTGQANAPASTAAQQKFPAVGAEVPSFELPDLDGKRVDLASLEGKVVLVNLWATWCGPCRAEIPGFLEMYAKEKANGLEIIGISVDSEGSEDAIRAFMAEYRITYPILYDPEGRSTELFETSVIPTSALLDRSGRVVWSGRGAFEPSEPDFTLALKKALQG